MSDNTEGIRQIAAIINSHGIKGEVKVLPLTDDVDLFLELDELITLRNSEREYLTLIGARKVKNQWLLKFEQINDIDEALRFKGLPLYTEESNLKPLEDDEFFIDDLLQAKVYSEDNQYLGTIVNYFEAGPQGVCEVESEDDTFLFPTSAEILKEVIPPDRVVIHLVPELRDLNKKKVKS